MTSKDEFLNKVNSFNIPGYTEEEFKEVYKADYPDDKNYEHIKVCPVCGRNYIDDSGCKMCGYDDYLYYGSSIYDTWVNNFKAKYESKVQADKDYVWLFDKE